MHPWPPAVIPPEEQQPWFLLLAVAQPGVAGSVVLLPYDIARVGQPPLAESVHDVVAGDLILYLAVDLASQDAVVRPASFVAPIAEIEARAQSPAGGSKRGP